MLQGNHVSSTEGSEEPGTVSGLGAWFEKAQRRLDRVWRLRVCEYCRGSVTQQYKACSEAEARLLIGLCWALESPDRV